MKIKKLIKFLLDNGLKDIVITVNKNICRSIEYHNHDIEKNELSDIISYTITALFDSKRVNITLEDISNKKEVLELLKRNALIENDNPLNNDLCEVVNDREYNISNIDYTNLNNHVMKYLDKYLELSDINASYGENIDYIDIYNSNKQHVQDANKYNYACFEVFAKKNDINSSSYLILFNKNEEEILKALEDKIKDVIMLLDVRKINTSKQRCIFTNNVVANILDAFIPIFKADKHYNGTTLLGNKLNQRIASDLVTIIEDPENDQFIGKRLFDDEGTKTSYKKLIDKGVYKIILYDKKYASIYKTVSTGNGYNGINVRSLYLEPGEEHLDLLKILNNGMLINEIEGMHAGINTITGEVSLQACGYIIQNGIIIGASKLFIISFNFLDFLNNIEYIDADLEFISSKCGAPSVIVREINVSS